MIRTRVLSVTTNNEKKEAPATNLDSIVLKPHLKYELRITILDSDIEMRITIEKDTAQKNRIVLCMGFYQGKELINFRSIDRNRLILLSNTYGTQINKKIKETQQTFSLSWVSFKNTLKSLPRVDILTKLNQIKEMLLDYKELRSTDIVTMSGYVISNNLVENIIARTTIELDADILTIIPEELRNTEHYDILLNFHSTNISLGNYIFLYPILRIFKLIRTARYISGMIPAFFWFATNYYLFAQDAFSINLIEYYLYPLINLIGIPIFMLMFIPKIVGYILRKKLFE